MRGPLNLLIVDADPRRIDAIQTRVSLLSLPYTCHCAASASEALEFLGRGFSPESCFKPNLMLVSLNLPGDEAGNLLRIVKSNPDLRSIPLIVISAPERFDDLEQAAPDGEESFTMGHDLEHGLALLAEIDHFWGDPQEQSGE